MENLNSLDFDEFYKRYKEGAIQPTTETIEITQEINDYFKKISGSSGAVHDDDDHARQLGYKSKISYGMLYEIVSVASSETLVGDNVVGYEWNVTFHKPLYVGDILHIKCEIENIIKAIKTVIVKITVTDEEGNLRSKVTCKGKFMK